MDDTEAGFGRYLIESHGVLDNAPEFEPAPPFDTVVVGDGDTEAEAFEDAVSLIMYGIGPGPADDLDLPAFWGNDESDMCAECERNGGQECFAFDCGRCFYIGIHFNNSAK